LRFITISKSGYRLIFGTFLALIFTPHLAFAVDDALFSQRTLTVNNVLDIYDISATASQDIGITLSVFLASEFSAMTSDTNNDNTAKIFAQDRAFGLSDRTAQIKNLALPVGDYIVVIAKDTPVDVDIKLVHHPLTELSTHLEQNISTSLKSPQKVSNDVIGFRGRQSAYIVPAAFSSDKPQTAQFTFSEGTGSLSLHNSKGKLLSRISGRSPLSMTSILGPGLILGVSSRLPRGTTKGQWRLRFEQTTNINWAIEGAENNELVSSYLNNTLSAKNDSIEGFLDESDSDIYTIEPDSTANLYTIKYEGPDAQLIADVNGSKQTLQGERLELGPFASNTQNQISIQRGEVGQYTLEWKPYFQTGHIAIEPDSVRGQKTFDATARVLGELSFNTDIDFIEFDSGEIGQMWRILVLGETVNKVNISDNLETLMSLNRPRRNMARKFPIPDIYFEPGKIALSIRGTTGKYKVILRPLGKPLDTSELEPNNKFPRRITIGKPYIGALKSGDIDKYSFFLLKPARLTLDFETPVGARFTGNFVTNGESQSGALGKMLFSPDERFFVVDLPAGEHIFSLRPAASSPADYRMQFKYESPFIKASNIAGLALTNKPSIKAFSKAKQKLTLDFDLPKAPIIYTNASALPSLKIWSPQLDLSIAPNELIWSPTSVSVPIEVQADVPDGSYFISIGVERDQRLSATINFELEASLSSAVIGPMPDLPATKQMLGGINVALSALGAKWLSLPECPLDPASGSLAKQNPSGAANLLMLNDGLQPLANRDYGTTLYNVGQRVYIPTLDLPGNEPIPLIGVGLTNRIQSANQFADFAIDVSDDLENWSQVLKAKLSTWGHREYFLFDETAVSAKYIRLRAFRQSNHSSNDPILLSEFEVIANPGQSALKDIDIGVHELGALGREFDTWGYARDFKFALVEKINGVIEQSPTPYFGAQEWTSTGVVKTFKNQSSAEVEALIFHYGQNSKGKAALPPKFAKVLSSNSGPYGTFKEIEVIELPDDFGPGSRFRANLAQRETMNAIRVEYSRPEKGQKNIMIPAYYEVIERAESENYHSILGLGKEFLANTNGIQPIDLKHKSSDFKAKGQVLQFDGKSQVGRVQFDKQTNQWRLLASDKYNTADITVQGETGFSPAISASKTNGETVEPIAISKNSDINETRYQFDLSNGDLFLEVTEPARSTVFLVDQSASAAAFAKPIRRAVIDFASDMVAGRDAILFSALGRDWSSKNWLQDPTIVRRNVLNYPLDGNSDAETSIVNAAERLKDRLGSRTIVIISDADAGPNEAIFKALRASAARVFVVKLSSGQMWGDPRQSIAVAQQWAAMSGGEMDYMIRSQDISTAYARVSARLLGEKAYQIQAEASLRITKPGSLLIERSAVQSNAQKKFYHVLFDASGSMLKRTDNSRRITIAKSAVADFVLKKLSPEDRIGIRIFGGAPDTCETQLLLDPTEGKPDSFLRQLASIKPQNNAKTPIAKALKKLDNDLKNTSSIAHVLLITDGEETCDGDAGEVIEQLIESQLVSRVDIISFALGESVNRRDFKAWAKKGRGFYIDAKDGDSLSKALETSVEERVDILQEGNVIVSYAVGSGALELAAGKYSIILNNQVREFEIISQETTKIDLSSSL